MNDYSDARHSPRQTTQNMSDRKRILPVNKPNGSIPVNKKASTFKNFDDQPL